MLERVKKTISRYNMFSAGSRVAVAVSGGPDSVCALLMLAELAKELGVQLRVAHFNHKLRGEASDDDESFVRDLAARLELPFHCSQERVGEQDGNLEQTARRARGQFFESLIRKDEVDLVATGHTRDDQAETVLFRILRGTGPTGMAGILPVTREGIVRPLLDVTRAEVEMFLRQRGASWREDSSNRENRFARNRIRHSLLPQLEMEWNPRLGSSLARMADVAFEEERWVEQVVEAELNRLALHRDGVIEIRASALRTLPRGLARRIVRAAVGRVKGDLRRLEFAHIEQVLEIAEGKSGEGGARLPGTAVVRSFDWLRISGAETRAGTEPITLTVPGTFLAPDGTSLCFFLDEAAGAAAYTCPNGATLKAAVLDRLDFAGLELRGWRVGDQYRPLGRSAHENVAEMFQRAKVPSWRRPYWPIVTYRGNILWAKGFGPAAEFAADAETARVLRIVELRGELRGELGSQLAGELPCDLDDEGKTVESFPSLSSS